LDNDWFGEALMPILGVIASSIQEQFDSDYELITTTVLTGNTASVTFSNLGDYSSTYKHLQIRLAIRSNRATNLDRIDLIYNGDTGANYASHELDGTGAGVDTNGQDDLSVAHSGYVTGGNNTANSFGGAVIDILDPYSTSKNTTTRSLSGFTGSGNYVVLFSNHWRNTAALTSVQVKPFGGTNWVTGSRFSLYGIRG
jgi:hypothetical protein